MSMKLLILSVFSILYPSLCSSFTCNNDADCPGKYNPSWYKYCFHHICTDTSPKLDTPYVFVYSIIFLSIVIIACICGMLGCWFCLKRRVIHRGSVLNQGVSMGPVKTNQSVVNLA